MGLFGGVSEKEFNTMTKLAVFNRAMYALSDMTAEARQGITGEDIADALMPSLSDIALFNKYEQEIDKSVLMLLKMALSIRQQKDLAKTNK